MWPENRKARVYLAAIVFIGLVLRLVWVISQGNQLTHVETLPDQTEYFQLGANLRHGSGLSFFDARFGEVVYAYRTPGYPLFIAACNAAPRAIRMAQALIDSATILAVYFLARKWLEERGALLAAAIVAVDPFLIYFCGLILSETLFVALLVWGMLLIVRAAEPWRLSWVAGGLVLSLAALVRPSAIALPVTIAILAAIANHKPGGYRSRWPAPVGLGMLLITLLVLFPWALRNRIKLGEWIWTGTNAGVTKYDGFNPDADGSSNQQFLQWMPWLKNMNETARSRYLGELADEYIKDNPGHCLSLALPKMGRTWSPIPLSQAFGGRRIYVVAAALFSLPLDLLVLAGLARGRMSARAKFLLLATPIYFTVVHAASVGSLRYRLPAEAPLAVLAAAALPARIKRSE